MGSSRLFGAWRRRDGANAGPLAPEAFEAPEAPDTPEAPEASEACVVPARIALLYESKDGRFCLFEDSQGHLSAVQSANLV